MSFFFFLFNVKNKTISRLCATKNRELHSAKKRNIVNNFFKILNSLESLLVMHTKPKGKIRFRIFFNGNMKESASIVSQNRSICHVCTRLTNKEFPKNAIFSRCLSVKTN